MEDDGQIHQRIITLSIGGAILAVVGILWTIVSIIGGALMLVINRHSTAYLFAYMPIFVTFFGFAMVGYALFIGGREAFGNPQNQPVKAMGPIYVVASLVLSEDGETVYDASMYEPEDLKYVVRVRLPDGRTREFETSYEVACMVGEGLWGNVTYQGRWLTSFHRVIIS